MLTIQTLQYIRYKSNQMTICVYKKTIKHSTFYYQNALLTCCHLML